MIKKTLIQHRFKFIALVILVALGQLVFSLFSTTYTAPSYESKLFFTTGIVFDGSDLHKLNEGAHYFGQTMIGWTKFPHFRTDLIEKVGLPLDSTINMHVQERQNMIFTVKTNEPLPQDSLLSVKDFLQSKVNEYNSNTNTEFIITNLDFYQYENKNTYKKGAFIAFLTSVAVFALGWFTKDQLTF